MVHHATCERGAKGCDWPTSVLPQGTLFIFQGLGENCRLRNPSGSCSRLKRAANRLTVNAAGSSWTITAGFLERVERNPSRKTLRAIGHFEFDEMFSRAKDIDFITTTQPGASKVSAKNDPSDRQRRAESANAASEGAAVDQGIPAASLDGACLLVCCHGGQGDLMAFSRRLKPLVARYGLLAAQSCALFGEPTLERSLEKMAKRGSPIYLVPFFFSEGVTHDVLAERLAHLDAKGCAGQVHLSPIFGRHPDLVNRIRATCTEALEVRNWKADETALLLVGHGTRRNPASRRRLETLVGELSGSPFRSIACAFLEEEPEIASALERLRERQVLVLGCFAEHGRHALEDVPAALAPFADRVSYLGPIGAAPWVPEMLIDLARIPARH